MAKYEALKDVWISHENRTVKEGETFEAVFPKGMKLGSNLKEVKGSSDKPSGGTSKPDTGGKPDTGAEGVLV